MQTIAYYIINTLLRAIALLPLRALYVVSDALCPLVHHVLKYKVACVRKNLRNAFPEKSAEELKDIENKFYHHLCDCIVESVKILHISEEEMKRRVVMNNVNLIDQATAKGQSVFLLLAHLGNWEWMQEISIRMTPVDVGGEIYRPLKSKVFGRAMETIRSRYPTQLIAQKEAARTLIKLYREHKVTVIGFISDQRPTRNSLHHWTTFLHQDTPYMVGAEQIGRHIHAKFVYFEVTKPRRGHYVVNIIDLNHSEEEIQKAVKEGRFPYMEDYYRLLEKNICMDPAIWLWSHNRWKHQRNQENNNKTE